FGFNFLNISFPESEYAALTFSDFEPPSPWGSYTDFISSNFLVVAPLRNYLAAYDHDTGTGLGEFAILPQTPPGTLIRGTISLFYDLYRNDPTSPNPEIFSLGNELSIDIDILVLPGSGTTGPPPGSPAPEPAPLVFVPAGLALIVLMARGARVHTTQSRA